MKDDPVIAEVRRIRHRISARCGHDPQRLMEHYQKYEKQLRRSGQFRFEGEPKAPVPAQPVH